MIMEIQICFSPDFYVSAVQALENTLGRGEIALNEQFLHFPQYFLPYLESFLPFSSHSIQRSLSFGKELTTSPLIN